MDPRRLLIPTLLGLALSACALVKNPPPPGPLAVQLEGPARDASAPLPIALTIASDRSPTERPYMADAAAEATPESSDTSAAPPLPPATVAAVPDHGRTPQPSRRVRQPAEVPGPRAIAAANAEALARSQADQFVGGVQVFGWEPGRVYEVWTAPLRVTTLTLAPGETLVSKAAGDTVRWQIGETYSGEGPSRRAHVMIKPFERGLETNLVLTTSRRVYLIQLRSGPVESFNTAVAWDLGSVFGSSGESDAGIVEPDPLVAPQGPLDARFRIEARGRRPRWTPVSVMTDGVRTFLRFPADLPAAEAPALFVLGPDRAPQIVNYRQQGGLWVVDQVLDRAELRLGDRRPQVVRIVRIAA